MLRTKSDKPSGYEYPRPSIDRGQTRTQNRHSPQTLSQKNAEKIRQVVRRDAVKSRSTG